MYSKINNQAPLYFYWHSLMSPVYCIDSCCVCDSNSDGWVDAWTMTLIVFINNKGWGTEAWSTKGVSWTCFFFFSLTFHIHDRRAIHFLSRKYVHMSCNDISIEKLTTTDKLWHKEWLVCNHWVYDVVYLWTGHEWILFHYYLASSRQQVWSLVVIIT